MIKIISLYFLLISTLYGITLKDLVVEALEVNPNIGLMYNELKNYNVRYKQAVSGYLPTVDLEVSGNIENRDYMDKTINNTKYDTSTVSVVVRQNLFNGFETMNTRNSLKRFLNARKFKLDERKNQIAYDVLETAINYRLIYEKNLLHEKLLEEYNHYLGLSIELYQAGQMLSSELNDLKSQLSMARTKYYINQERYNQLKFKLNKLVGRYINAKDIDLGESLEIVVPKNPKIVISEMLEKNPTLEAERENIDGARYDYKASAGKYYPNISLELTADKYLDSGMADMSTTQTDKTYTARLVVRWNIFNGWADKREREKKFIEIQRSKLTLETLKNDAIEEITLAFNNISMLRRQKPHLENYLELVEKKLTESMIEYKVGRKMIADIIPIIPQPISAKQELLQTEYMDLLGEYRVLKSFGVLHTYFELNEIPERTQIEDKGIKNCFKTNKKMSDSLIEINVDKNIIVLGSFKNKNNAIKIKNMFNSYGVFVKKTIGKNGVFYVSYMYNIDKVEETLKNIRVKFPTVYTVSKQRVFELKRYVESLNNTNKKSINECIDSDGLKHFEKLQFESKPGFDQELLNELEQNEIDPDENLIELNDLELQNYNWEYIEIPKVEIPNKIKVGE
jgi:adhesin transport system outer membrane protein